MMAKVSPVMYELVVPSRRSKSKVTYVNRLKHEDEEPTGRVVLSKPELTAEQSRQLEALIEEFSDVVCTSVGKVVSH